MILDAFWLLSGFLLLIWGAHQMTGGAVHLAQRFGMAPLTVGLTVVAFGTSAPELIVNIVAAIEGSPEPAFANVAGSNPVNLLLILGITGLIARLTVSSETVRREIPLSFLAVILVPAVAYFGSRAGVPTLGRIGAVFFAGDFCRVSDLPFQQGECFI